jgi:cob(I)alamin adenosyltransferase
MLEKGLVQIYTGDGKGKTTAAFGQALRAAGQGSTVLIYQFLKPPDLDAGERLALQSACLKIKVETLDVPWDMSESFHDERAVARTQAAIRELLGKLAQTVQEQIYDVLVLDEIVFCLSEGLATVDDIRRIIDKRRSGVEIILTGRGATRELIELADLVTEMKSVKHPFDKGLPARRGIEY